MDVSHVTLFSLEPDRLESLETYGLRSDEVTDVLSGMVELVASACSTPTAMVALAEGDLLRFVAGVGDVDPGVRREGSYCEWVIDNQVSLVVADGREDPRFKQHPRVLEGTAVAFAGVPLIGRDGLPIGVLCAVDRIARTFTEPELTALRTLAESVVTALELRRLDLYRGLPSDVAAQGKRLRRALEQKELVTWFQPIVDLRSGRPWALEALVRWEHPQRGLLGPADFLPAVEHSGLSLPLGRHVLHQSLQVVADLRSRSELPEMLLVAVNVSPLQLERPGLASSLLADLAAHRIDPTLLAVEVTETSLMRHPDVVARELHQLREAGVHLALDDYGTGRASLRQLLELPFSALKLDGCLTARVVDDPRTLTVVRSTIRMAEDLGVVVLAEGVETEPQRDALVELGCFLGQGHAFDQAAPASQLPILLARSRGRSVPRPARPADHAMATAADGPDVLEKVLRGTRPVVLIASADNRVAIERALARRGVNAVTRPGYAVLRADEVLAQIRVGTGIDADAFRRVVAPLVPIGATVWSDLAGLLWARGETTAAIELEDLMGQLPAAVICSHESWALAAFGTAQQVRRLQDQHPTARPVAPATGDWGALRPAARELLERMVSSGASPHSIAAALNAEGHPTPWGVRWHWRQVARLTA